MVAAHESEADGSPAKNGATDAKSYAYALLSGFMSAKRRTSTGMRAGVSPNVEPCMAFSAV
jgi:hypothetical protein